MSTVDWSDRFWSKVHPEALSGCWLWHGATNFRGYGLVQNKGRRPRQLKAHRVAYERVHGPIPAGMFVCHRCDVPACVNPDHLFLGTCADNNRDMRRKGRARVSLGEANGQSVLTAESVLEIKRALATDEPRFLIAQRFGVAPSTVHNIRAGLTWKGVQL